MVRQREDCWRRCQRRPNAGAEGFDPDGGAGYAGDVSTATTQGIKVTVTAEYLTNQSSPAVKRYVFAYKIRIDNEGGEAAQLKSRHWIITDGNGKVEEVRGPGVVGQQPLLRPGEHFEYTSGCVLETPRGTMQGSYQMHRPDGSIFDAQIAPFALALPFSLN